MKKITIPALCTLATEKLGKSTLSYDELKQLSSENDVQIPYRIWKECRVAKNTFDLTIEPDGTCPADKAKAAKKATAPLVGDPAKVQKAKATAKKLREKKKLSLEEALAESDAAGEEVPSADEVKSELDALLAGDASHKKEGKYGSKTALALAGWRKDPKKKWIVKADQRTRGRLGTI